MVAADGGIFSFSDKPFAGSLGANPPARRIVFAATLDSRSSLEQRVHGEEAALRLEPLLAAPVSRHRWMASHLGVAFAGSAAILAAGGFGVGLAYAFVTRDAAELPRLAADALVYLPAIWVLVAIGAALYGLVPRLGAAVWALLAFSLVVGFFGEILDLPSWVTATSPFEHTPLVPSETVTATPLLTLTTTAAGLCAAGAYGFRRRDLA